MYKILIADDEPIERMVARKIIDTHFAGQLESLIAENGQDAVEIFEREECQIALFDIEMPGMSGLEAASLIRKNHPAAQIIFLTAFDEFDYAKRAISVHALDYLLKPTDDKELMIAIEEAIRLLDRATEEATPVQAAPASETSIQNNDGAVDDSGKLSAVRHQISSYLEANYMHDLTLSSIAETMNYSDAYFCKIFKQCFGVSFVMYLADLRVKKAKEMLEDITINIKEISGLVGYQDPNYFTKVFKRMVGMTPSDYRIKALNQKEY